MLKSLKLLICSVLMATSAHAHEFWIEPGKMVLASGEPLSPRIMIGERLDGNSYTFQPRAFSKALWIGPTQVVDLNFDPRTARRNDLTPFEDGMHVLALETRPQRLFYSSRDAFERFLKEIGREDALERPKGIESIDGSIRETYRRLNKTLVRFGSPSGQDQRVGLPMEWVLDGDAFRFFDGQNPKKGQLAHVTCKAGPEPNEVTTQAIRTDEDGYARPVLPDEAQCLINTVVLRWREDIDMWHSDWISLFFDTSFVLPKAL